jgi:regulator of nucleoside diphosphate kinase
MKPDHTIKLTEADLVRLSDLRTHRALAQELDRAVVLSSGPVPPDLVTLNSTVVYEDEHTGMLHDITIVYPPEADPRKGNISVLAPLGTALLGLSVGQSIVWPFPGGSTRALRVVRLLYQPEAAERELRPAQDRIDR